MPSKASFAVTSRYALALIELAAESGKTASIEKDLAELEAMVKASPELAGLLYSPVLGVARQSAALQAIAEKAKFDGLTRNFLGVLAQNRRLAATLSIIEAVKAELSKQRGEIAVEVKTAQDMTPAQTESLRKAIAKGLGREVSMKAVVEPSILGGLIVTVGSKMIDDSVARKLQLLKAAMGRQSNENTAQQPKSGKV